jgi:hypothetical protein
VLEILSSPFRAARCFRLLEDFVAPSDGRRCQCDLVDNREVSNVEGRDLAKSFEVPFFESSAKSRINVEEAFYELVRVFAFGFGFGLLLPFSLLTFVAPADAGSRNPPSVCLQGQCTCRCSCERESKKERMQSFVSFSDLKAVLSSQQVNSNQLHQ